MKFNLSKSWFLRMVNKEEECSDISAVSPELLAEMNNKKLDNKLQQFVNKFEDNVRNIPMHYPNQDNK